MDMLSHIEMSQLLLPSGRTVEAELQYSARMLVKYIQDGINDYYASYSPSFHQRTGQLKRAVTMSDISSVSYSSDKAHIAIIFNSNRYQGSSPNVGRVHWSDALILVDQGWQVVRGWHRNIPHFGFQSGAQFIDDAIGRFNVNNPLGIEVTYI